MVDPAFMIYRLTCSITGKSYIGQTKHDPAARLRQHAKGNRHCVALSAAIAKHGIESFKLETLCVCPDQDYADQVERDCIRAFGTLAPAGYNLREGGTVLHGFAPESIERIRHKAKARGVSQACRDGNLAAMIGRKQSAETRAKRSAALKGRPRAPEVVARIAQSRRMNHQEAANG